MQIRRGAASVLALLVTAAPVLGAEAASAAPAPDPDPPVVVASATNPRTLDVSDQSRILTLTAHITDVGSGVGDTVVASVDRGSKSLGLVILQRTSGYGNDGHFSGTLTVPTGTDPGAWTPTMTVTDGADNTTVHTFDPLTVVNTHPDPGGPVVVDSTTTPDTVDVTGGSRTVTLSAHVTDEGTGVDGDQLVASVGNGSRILGLVVLERVSGDALDGVYDGTMTVSTSSAPGTYTPTMTVRDGADNATTHVFDPVTVVNEAARVPGAPTRVSAVKGDRSAVVSWSAPADDGGSVVTAYTVTSSPGGIIRTVPGDTTTATVDGLTNGTSYAFTVTASNRSGSSPASTPSNVVTPVGAPAPGAPTGVHATPGDGTATVSWTAVAGTVTSYQVTSSPGGRTATVSGDRTSATVTGLVNGTAYTFTVTATTAAGTSAPSMASDPVTPASAPAAPTDVVAVAGDRVAQVSWTAPAESGSPITRYRVVASPSGLARTVTGDRTVVLLPGLTNGTTYRFTVTATSAAGDSPPSTLSNAVTPVPGPSSLVPATPSIIRTTVTDTGVELVWAPPAAGTPEVSGYHLTSNHGHDRRLSRDRTQLVLTGLARGRYTLTLTATNVAGDSPPTRVRFRIR